MAVARVRLRVMWRITICTAVAPGAVFTVRRYGDTL